MLYNYIIYKKMDALECLEYLQFKENQKLVNGVAPVLVTTGEIYDDLGFVPTGELNELVKLKYIKWGHTLNNKYFKIL